MARTTFLLWCHSPSSKDPKEIIFFRDPFAYYVFLRGQSTVRGRNTALPKKPWLLLIPLQIPTSFMVSHSFQHGANGFCPYHWTCVFYHFVAKGFARLTWKLPGSLWKTFHLQTPSETFHVSLRECISLATFHFHSFQGSDSFQKPPERLESCFFCTDLCFSEKQVVFYPPGIPTLPPEERPGP